MDSFSEALLACHAAVYRYARALTRDAADADELVQETYRRALAARSRPRVEAVDGIRRWLFTILRNHWLNEVKHRRLEMFPESIGVAEGVSEETPEHILSRRFLQSEVRDAIDALPDPFREVIVLRELESLTYTEIAQLTGAPIGTVMSRLARARSALRQTLAALSPKSSPEGAGRT